MSKVVFCQRLWQMEMAPEQEWNPPHPSQISQGIDLFVLLDCSAAFHPANDFCAWPAKEQCISRGLTPCTKAIVIRGSSSATAFETNF